MERTEERLAVIKLAEIVAQFPFLESSINPLITRLMSKGEVTHEIVNVGIENGLFEAMTAFRELYFKNIGLTESRSIIESYFKRNNLEFGPKKLDSEEK